MLQEFVTIEKQNPCSSEHTGLSLLCCLDGLVDALPCHFLLILFVQAIYGEVVYGMLLLLLLLHFIDFFCFSVSRNTTICGGHSCSARRKSLVLQALSSTNPSTASFLREKKGDASLSRPCFRIIKANSATIFPTIPQSCRPINCA